MTIMMYTLYKIMVLLHMEIDTSFARKMSALLYDPISPPKPNVTPVDGK